MSITHAYTSTKEEPADSTVIGAAKWNASHVEDYPAYFNVRDYGADGNGSTDDTTAITDAITAATTSVGGIVFFPPGIYVTQPLTLPPGTVLQGVSGQGYYNATTTVPNAETQSRIKLKAASADSLIKPDDTGANHSTHVRLRDLCFDNNAIAQRTIDLPDHGSSMSRFWTMERCYIVNSGQSGSGYAVYIGNLNTACTMRDCIVFNGTSGSAGGYHGVGWYGQDGLMDNCYIGYCAGNGLEVLGGTSNITFQMLNGGIFTCTTGIVLAGRGAKIINVSIDHNYNDGIYAGYGPAYIAGCTFHTNSRTTNNTWSDISLNTANQTFTLSGNMRFDHSGETTNNTKYFLNNNTTGTTVNGLSTCIASPDAEFGTSWTNYS